MEFGVEAKVALGLAWVLGFFLLERLRPAAPLPARVVERDGRFGQGRILRNLGLVLINVGISRFIVLPVTALAAAAAPDWRPGALSGWTGLILDLLILEFLIYWWHRVNHAVPFLWRFHEVHHLDEFLDTTSAVRFHAGEVILSALTRAVVVFALDVDVASVLVFETLLLFAAVFQHSNVRLPARLESALSKVLITPSIHWVHHHAVRQDTDSNFGLFFSVWDRMFGTLSPNPRTMDMPIGVEQRSERGFMGLLARPLDAP